LIERNAHRPPSTKKAQSIPRGSNMKARIFPNVRIAAAVGATLLFAPAHAADPASGQRIAERWCASCHVVKAGQQAASADVPPFAEVATRYADVGSLTAFLSAPYPRMPAMALSREEIGDLVAYIRTLGPPRVDPPGPPEKDRPPEQPRRG
jgi:mono/diheme cytochrome c family protein